MDRIRDALFDLFGLSIVGLGRFVEGYVIVAGINEKGTILP